MISVIVPAYNVSPYIERSVKSVIAQTFNDWELIAIDDGSNDDTWQKLQKLATLDSRIKVFTQPNQGVVKTRENAVAKAKGEYLFFLDGDDYLPHTALQLLLDRIAESNADIVIGSYTLEWLDGREKIVNNRKAFDSNVDALTYCLVNGEMFLPIKLYRTEIFRASVNIPSNLFFEEDVVGVMQYLVYCKSASFVCDPVYTYCRREGSASSSAQRPGFVRNVIAVINMILNMADLSNKNLRDAIDSFCISNIFDCLHCNIKSDEREDIISISKKIDWNITENKYRSKRLKDIAAACKEYIEKGTTRKARFINFKSAIRHKIAKFVYRIILFKV